MSLALRGEARRTLEKNDINDVRKMFILPDDCYAIVDVLQTSLNQLTQTGLLRPVIFCFRFGEKMTCGLSLSDFNTQFTLRKTIHVAANILSDCEEVDLLWSTAGVLQIIGHRGTLCTCLFFKDCANYQSNLDGRPLDIKTCSRTIVVFHTKCSLFNFTLTFHTVNPIVDIIQCRVVLLEVCVSHDQQQRHFYATPNIIYLHCKATGHY